MAEEKTNLAPAIVAQQKLVPPVLNAFPPLRLDGADKLAFVGTSLIALFVYLWTIAPEVTLGDSGILATSGAYAGVPAPPAYPAWVIYSWLFTKLIPFSNHAWRIAFGSAFAAALACGLVAQIISMTGNLVLPDTPKYARLEFKERCVLRLVCGCVAGLCLAFSGTVWREAVIVSTWSFGLLIFMAVLWCFTHCCFAVGQRRSLCAALFLFGILLANNQEMFALLPGFVGLLVLCKPQLGRDVGFCVLPLTVLVMYGSSIDVFYSLRYFVFANLPITGAFTAAFLASVAAIFLTRATGSHVKTALIGCLCLTCGWLLYLYPPIASMSTPPVNWGYPRNFEGFGRALVRGHYEKHACVDSPESYVPDILHMVWRGGNDFGWSCFAIALVPYGLLFKRSQRAWRWLLGLAAVGVCALLAVLATLEPDDFRQRDWDVLQVHLAPALAVVAIFMGIGLMQIGAMLARP